MPVSDTTRRRNPQPKVQEARATQAAISPIFCAKATNPTVTLDLGGIWVPARRWA